MKKIKKLSDKKFNINIDEINSFSPRKFTEKSLYPFERRRLQKVYRFFNDATHADLFASGSIWISTLKTCRAYEDKLQGDAEEGLHTFSIPHLHGGPSDPYFKKATEKIGIRFIGGENITVSGVSKTEGHLDAFLICASKISSSANLSKTFGNFCVEINDAHYFSYCVLVELAKKYSLHQAATGSIVYADRKYTDPYLKLGPIGFVKPPKYKEQDEFRFLWSLKDCREIKPFLLEVPTAKKICKRIF